MRRSSRLRVSRLINYRNFDGVTHEFFGTGAVVDKAKEAVNLAAQGLKTAFAQPKSG